MKKIIFILAVLFSTISFADSNCSQLYPNGIQIEITDKSAVELCNVEYVAIYSVDKKANIFSSEHITGKIVPVTRVNAFKADERIAKGQRAELSDYVNTRYDKGHMAPADDMTTPQTMQQSFLLTNMTPQNKKLNEVTWRILESKVRKTQGVTYILTGAFYDNNPKVIGKNKIPVPSGYFKCMWVIGGDPVCYEADNTSSAIPSIVNYSEVKTILNFK